MYQRIAFASFFILAALSPSQRAQAATYAADCGTNDASSIVQNQLNAIGSSPSNTLQVTGTCVGDLTISRADRLTITGLVVTGTVSVSNSIQVGLLTARINGQVFISNSRPTQLNAVAVTGWVNTVPPCAFEAPRSMPRPRRGGPPVCSAEPICISTSN